MTQETPKGQFNQSSSSRTAISDRTSDTRDTTVQRRNMVASSTPLGKLRRSCCAPRPGARVVKAFNHLTVPNLEADPVVKGARRVVFVSADDDAAKKRVEILLKELGYSFIDLGDLRDGCLFQQAGGSLAGRDLLERGEYRKKGDSS
jgi:hypothetical protein